MKADKPTATVVSVVGRCIGRQLYGKRCMCVTLVGCDAPNNDNSDTTSTPEQPVPTPMIIHLSAGHVPRGERLKLETIPACTPVFVVFMIRNDESGLSEVEFQKLSDGLNSFGFLTKPHIGAIFRVTGTLMDTIEMNGCPAQKLDATSAEVLYRGTPAMPGDYGEKWNQPSEPKKPRGRVVHSSNRFKEFAAICLKVMSDAARGDSASVKGLHVVDVAGGAGKLSAQFSDLGWHSTIVDPRCELLRPALRFCTTPVAVVQELLDTQSQAAVLQAADIIVGLHCDGAVNEIVTAACTFEKSFIICACCVFPRYFERVLNNGQPVVLRDELNSWIIEECNRRKYPGTLVRFVAPFEGANECVIGTVSSRA